MKKIQDKIDLCGFLPHQLNALLYVIQVPTEKENYRCFFIHKSTLPTLFILLFSSEDDSLYNPDVTSLIATNLH